MPFIRVDPHDTELVAQLVDLQNAASALDDPDGVPSIAEEVAGGLKYGWDLEPGEQFLYAPTDGAAPVGALGLNWPRRTDNLHLVTCSITVHPEHRRQGHGTAMMGEVVRRTRELGRNTIWAWAPEDDEGPRIFLEQHGFSYASHEARRKQKLAEVDQEAVAQLYAQAVEASTDYVVERVRVPTDDALLNELIEVTAAINDAPMGDLTFEDEKFDLQRLRDFETAAQNKGERLYRVYARHRETGAVGGHTIVMVSPHRPDYAFQYDTAVSRDHRGHRLGLLLKVDMMHWMAEVEPQIHTIETWNQADNNYMISVNESIGYRLSRIFADFERVLPTE